MPPGSGARQHPSCSVAYSRAGATANPATRVANPSAAATNARCQSPRSRAPAREKTVHNPSGCAQHNNDDNNFFRTQLSWGVLGSPREPKDPWLGRHPGLRIKTLGQ
jgi:hypothetical protein